MKTKKHRGWGAPGMSLEDAMAIKRSFEYAEDEATARLASARIWADGPRCRSRGLNGYRLWGGWPTDEITACHKQLARDARAITYKKEK